MRNWEKGTLVTSGLTGTFFPSASCPDLGMGNKLLEASIYLEASIGQAPRAQNGKRPSLTHSITQAPTLELWSLRVTTHLHFAPAGLALVLACPGGNFSEEHRAFWATGSK